MQIENLMSRTLTLAALALVSLSTQAAVVYSSIPNSLPDNVPSYGYAANGIDELYDQVRLAPGGRKLQSITLTMSDWAMYSTYQGQTGYSAAGYNQSLEIDLFDSASGYAYLGSDIITALVPWRPEPTANCSADPADTLNPKGYGATCAHGVAFNVTFDLSSQNIILPDDIIFGLTFQTQNNGYDPVTGDQGGTGKPGPYNSLNLGIGTGATVGFEDVGNYASHVAAQIVTTDAASVPEPSTVSLFGIALVGMLGAARRRRRTD